MSLPDDVLPEGRYVDVGHGRRLHLHDIGEGAPVLWLHGSGPGASGWSNFHPNARTLAEAGYRSVLLDILGYGRSSKPTDVDYTFDVLGGAVIAALDALGLDRVHLVGNSMGGALALWLALEHPDRVGKLVLMAPGGLEERDTYMAMPGIRSMLRCIYGDDGITLFGMQKVFTKQVFDPSQVPEGVIERRTTLALTQPQHVFRTLRVPNQASRLGELQMPVLCLWGMNDLFCPPSGAQTVANAVADAAVVLLTQCGHWVMVEKRAIFDRTVRGFLDG